MAPKTRASEQPENGGKFRQMAQNPSIGDDQALRRLAIQLTAQLPEAEVDALMVLDYCSDLVCGFMRGRPGEHVSRENRRPQVVR
jgi:hypothetical protein